ncbi:hypothetical protein [Aliivibrio fischeri]|uniref:hypothetical protein n=1 Tax=Aliivibrio fischeri TaxID=668 RepID=UPI001F45B968|nr:hypothetical protein [Aliivibrio fischeri]
MRQLENVLLYPLAICLIPGGITGPSKAEQLIRNLKIKKKINLRISDISLMTNLPIPHEIVPQSYQHKITLFCHQTNRNQPLS